jgi:hypothetical protein
MRALFAGGGIVALILALMLAEALLLGLYHRRTGRGIAPRDLLPNLAAGALLLLALRAALASSNPLAPAPWLAAALLAHLWDLARRWRR